MRKFNIIWLALSIQTFANPLNNWSQFPSQQLITKQSSAVSAPAPQATIEHNYEDIVVFSLTAAIAAFHINPKSFIEDRIRLDKYFDQAALDQINQVLLPGSGTGLLDRCVIHQVDCNAIARAPIIIEQEAQHHLQVRLPMILDTEQKVDVILSLSRQSNTPLRIQNFAVESIQ